MKKVKKSKAKKAPTTTDMMSAVQDLTEAVQVGFERHEKILKTLVEGQEQLRESVNILDQRVSKTQNRIEDVLDENRDSILGHERRIRHLERARA
ncbi:MAG: hypothetical protein WC217_00860 [Candidatus Paceibacterota bacterium]|jgi:hypothetical protein